MKTKHNENGISDQIRKVVSAVVGSQNAYVTQGNTIVPLDSEKVAEEVAVSLLMLERRFWA